ncbi:MAG: CHRD domain-containing protein [Natronosporangium sp.]
MAAVATGSAATARGGQSEFREQLTGYEETPLAVSTSGNGQVRLQIHHRRDEISYRVSYDQLEGDVTQAHIHFGAPAQTGGISVFLCTNLGNGPEGTQECPASPATITGTIGPDDVIAGAAQQGLAAGEFDELVDAIRAGATYVNVHSTLFPIGEVRGQLESDHRH